MKQALASHFASVVAFFDPKRSRKERCIDAWNKKHAACDALLPSGSGLDASPRIDIDASRPDRLVFTHCDFHHMDAHGYYDGWTEHTVIVTPAFSGIDVRVTGRDRDGIKDYIAETFHETLSREHDLTWVFRDPKGGE